MHKFYKKINKDLKNKRKNHDEWIIIRDKFISKCLDYNISWEKVKDAFILLDEEAEKYLWSNFNNEFLVEIKNFIDKPSPSEIITILSNPIKDFNNFASNRKRIWKYKKLKFFESYDNIKEMIETLNFNIMLFNKYHNGKNIIEIQII
jgi:hypothetical protein